ncbi:MAG: radical SAM protein [Anaerolineales bacterium]|nr:radical SAM protein [Anaerolineales bacterium]
MTSESEQILSTTESVCPECLAKIPARRVAVNHDIYLEKTCPEHGVFRTVIWRGEPAFTSWIRPKTPAFPANPFTAVDRGCPYDCGLCPEHRQHTCHVLLEVTQRCDLLCPICYASSGKQNTPDPSLETIAKWYQRILDSGGPFNIQLSGGEPALRDDLPEIISLGRSQGFSFFQINTNGIRLANDPAYLKALKDAGLSTVFLQFDGANDEIHQKLRGKPLMVSKQRAIENCVDLDIGVILVPTLIPGVNSQDIGNIIRYALQYAPTVRGVHFQPVSYFGRYFDYHGDESRLTIPEIIRALEEQTDGLIQIEAFRPSGCENALCSFHANFVILSDNKLLPLTQHQAKTSCCCQPEDGAQGAALSRNFIARQWIAPKPDLQLPITQTQSLGEWDTVLERARTHSFYISGMAFQDAWNLDLERLRDCCIHIMSPDGYLIPFCAYNLTSQSGRTLYRNTHQKTT